jgi:phosphate transport system permease protein
VNGTETIAKRKSGRSAFDLVAERGIEWLIKLCGISAILFVFGIVFFIVREGWGAFAFLTPGNFVFNTRWDPMAHNFGIGALILGTLSVTALAMLIAVPFGLGAAVFVSEFCTGKTKETLKVVIELLAAIPSVVWGFIGVALLGPMIQKTFDSNTGVNMLNASILLALMSVPIMVSIGEDALKAVPDTYREASLALGATKWQTIWRVLMPAAKNGLLAAVLLGVGRAIGETMAVLMATGHSARVPTSILDPVQTLTATIAAELGEARQGSEISQALFLIGVLLFGITFVVNLAADLVVRGIKKK